MKWNLDIKYLKIITQKCKKKNKNKKKVFLKTYLIGINLMNKMTIKNLIKLK